VITVKRGIDQIKKRLRTACRAQLLSMNPMYLAMMPRRVIGLLPSVDAAQWGVKDDVVEVRSPRWDAMCIGPRERSSTWTALITQPGQGVGTSATGGVERHQLTLTAVMGLCDAGPCRAEMVKVHAAALATAWGRVMARAGDPDDPGLWRDLAELRGVALDLEEQMRVVARLSQSGAPLAPVPPRDAAGGEVVELFSVQPVPRVSAAELRGPQSIPLGTYAGGTREVVAIPQDEGWTLLDVLADARGEDLDRDGRELTPIPLPLPEVQALARAHLRTRRAECNDTPPPGDCA
jgi:hypothetical protein